MLKTGIYRGKGTSCKGQLAKKIQYGFVVAKGGFLSYWN
jgi:hypothetical protein